MASTVTVTLELVAGGGQVGQHTGAASTTTCADSKTVCTACFLVQGAQATALMGQRLNAETVMGMTKQQQALRRRQHAAGRTARPVMTARAQLPLKVIFLAMKLAGVLTAKAIARQEGSRLPSVRQGRVRD